MAQVDLTTILSDGSDLSLNEIKVLVAALDAYNRMREAAVIDPRGGILDVIVRFQITDEFELTTRTEYDTEMLMSDSGVFEVESKTKLRSITHPDRVDEIFVRYDSWKEDGDD